MAATTKQIGQRGEQIAAEYLRRKGYNIITLNWRCQYGEIDIVARQQEMIVFVEVRARHTPTTEAAFESITPRKRQRMVNSAYAYINAHDLSAEIDWRIDVIGIALRRSAPPLIDHAENALDW